MNISYIRTVIIALLIIAAAICLSIASVSYFRTNAFVGVATRAPGSVVRIEEKRGRDGAITFVSIFQFRDATGTLHTVRDSISSHPAAHAVGDSVSVLFDPEAPDEARIDSVMSLRGLSMAMAVLGGVALLIAIAIYLATSIYLRGRNRNSFMLPDNGRNARVN